MENNSFNENNLSQPQMNSFLPMVPISVNPSYDFPLLPGGRNYAIPDYNRGLSHRELLKERIRQQMYAEKALEEELRREILMEKDFQIPKVMFPNNQLYERAFNEGTIGSSSGLVNDEAVPFQRDPRAMVPKVESSATNSAERILLLPKKPNVSGHVRIGFTNVESTPTKRVKELADAGSVKNDKRDLHCFLCQLTATSAQALEDHLRGKKHQAKAAKLKVKHNANWKKGNNKKN